MRYAVPCDSTARYHATARCGIMYQYCITVCRLCPLQCGCSLQSRPVALASFPRREVGKTFSDRQLVEELASLADIKDTDAFGRSFRDQMDVLSDRYSIRHSAWHSTVHCKTPAVL